MPRWGTLWRRTRPTSGTVNVAKKCLITPRHRCYFTQSSNGGVGEGGREGEEYCVFSIRIISLLSSLSSAAAAAAAAGSTSSVRSFARPPVVPQTPLISFQDRSMTFCYAPQVQAEPSLLPPFPPAAVFADRRLSLGPDLAARWTILFAK